MDGEISGRERRHVQRTGDENVKAGGSSHWVHGSALGLRCQSHVRLL